MRAAAPQQRRTACTGRSVCEQFLLTLNYELCTKHGSTNNDESRVESVVWDCAVCKILHSAVCNGLAASQCRILTSVSTLNLHPILWPSIASKEKHKRLQNRLFAGLGLSSFHIQKLLLWREETWWRRKKLILQLGGKCENKMNMLYPPRIYFCRRRLVSPVFSSDSYWHLGLYSVPAGSFSRWLQ